MSDGLVGSGSIVIGLPVPGLGKLTFLVCCRNSQGVVVSGLSLCGFSLPIKSLRSEKSLNVF